MGLLNGNIEWIIGVLLALFGAGGAAYIVGRGNGKKSVETRQARKEEKRAQERTQKVADDAMQKKEVEQDVAAGGSARDQLADSRWVRDKD